jgi:hypothetical protein
MDSVIVLPGLHANDRLGEVCEVVEGACHRAEDTGNTLLTGHTGVHAGLGPAASAAAERVNTTPSSGHSNRARNVGADTNPAALSEKSGFTTS